MSKRPLMYFSIALFISFLMAVTNSLPFFIGLVRQPAGSVFLGTVHYWEDYFFYLNHFFQGSHGAWLTANRYTSEITAPSIVYWSNILMGKTGSIVGLSPILAYNSWLLVTSFVMLLTLLFILIRHFGKRHDLWFPAFLFAVLSSSLQNRVTSSEGMRIWWPFQIWKTPHFAYDRLGGAPHQIIQTILFYILSVSLVSDIRIPRFGYAWIVIPTITGMLLSSINPVATVTIFACAAATHGIRLGLKKGLSKETLMKTAVAGSASAAVSFYMLGIMNTQPHIQTKIWEAVNQNATTWPFLSASIGPVIVFLLTGAVIRFLAADPLELYSIMMTAGTYVLFMSPLPRIAGIGNMRFLFPATHLFIGILASWGLQGISRKIHSSLGLPLRYASLLLLSIFVLLSSGTLIWELSQKNPKDNALLMYLPDTIQKGFDFLERQKPYDLVALGNSGTHMDTLIPALSGHTSVSGHILHTIRNSDKQLETYGFYGMTMPDPKEFLDRNRVSFVLFTQFDGDRTRFEQTYPYLKKLYENPGVSVYKVQYR